MEFAYLDESGDPGAKGSKKIMTCLVCTRQKKKLNKIIRKTKQRLLRKNKTAKWLYKRGGEIKFSSFPDKNLLINTLKEISKVDLKIYYICFNKKREDIDMGSKGIILMYLFWHIFEKSNRERPQKIISDLSFFGTKVNFPSYFILTDYQREKIRQIGKDTNKLLKLKDHIKFDEVSLEQYKSEISSKDKFLIKVEPVNSRMSDELQAVDLICGSIFQYLENNNPEYIDIIKNKIEIGNEVDN